MGNKKILVEKIISSCWECPAMEVTEGGYRCKKSGKEVTGGSFYAPGVAEKVDSLFENECPLEKDNG